MREEQGYRPILRVSTQNRSDRCSRLNSPEFFYSLDAISIHDLSIYLFCKTFYFLASNISQFAIPVIFPIPRYEEDLCCAPFPFHSFFLFLELECF